MPNILAQKLDALGISITMTNGATFSKTAVDLRARFLLETGNTPAKKSKVVTWVRNEFAATMNTSQLDPANIQLDFNTATGAPLELTITG